jgi:FkbM family methyltransferase
LNLEAYLAEATPQTPILQLLFKDVAPTIFLEIGACEGEDSIRYLKLFPEMNLYAFEPHPGNVAKIRNNPRLDLNPRFSLFEMAVSDHDGECQFHLSSGQPEQGNPMGEWDFGNKSSSILAPSKLMDKFVPWLRFSDSITIQTMTLQSIFNKHNWAWVDFLHMDVQGAELAVLRGGLNQLQKVRSIWLEVSFHEIYEDQAKPSEIEALLTSRGFLKVLEKVDSGFGDQLYVNTSAFHVTPC